MNSASELLIDPLFLNNEFKITEKVLHFKEWTRKNIFFVKDLLKENGKFLKVKNSMKNMILEYNFSSILDVLMLLELI